MFSVSFGTYRLHPPKTSDLPILEDRNASTKEADQLKIPLKTTELGTSFEEHSQCCEHCYDPNAIVTQAAATMRPPICAMR